MKKTLLCAMAVIIIFSTLSCRKQAILHPIFGSQYRVYAINYAVLRPGGMVGQNVTQFYTAKMNVSFWEDRSDTLHVLSDACHRYSSTFDGEASYITRCDSMNPRVVIEYVTPTAIEPTTDGRPRVSVRFGVRSFEPWIDFTIYRSRDNYPTSAIPANPAVMDVGSFVVTDNTKGYFHEYLFTDEY